MKRITSWTFLTFFLPLWPSPLTFDSCSYHDRNTGNKVCLGLYTYITKVVCSSRNPCYQFCIEDIRKSYKIHTWDIYICASRFIYFRLAQFEETNGVLHYRTIIKHSLFLSWEERVWVNVSHTYNHLSSASRGKQWGETCECCKSLLCQHHVSHSFIINI